MSRHCDRRGQIADFWDSFETINWLYLLFKCGIKTKTHFEWLLWHWSSLGQLNLEPTRPNGLVGCKVPTDLVKIIVKEATHMGFHYIIIIIIIIKIASAEVNGDEAFLNRKISNGNIPNRVARDILQISRERKICASYKK